MSILQPTDGPTPLTVALIAAGMRLVKEAGAPVPAMNLAGTLYLSSSGYLLLGVPNALVRGVYQAMREPGVELPPGGPGGEFNAHITVFRPEEVAKIGGPEKVTERGKQFHYALGRLMSLDTPNGWEEISKVWYLRVHSIELQNLRKSYGLSATPNEGKYDFHVTVAVRKKNVLRDNEKAVSRVSA